MQHTNGKSAEPSMDDILASIRKIIAEEPVPATGTLVRPSVPSMPELAGGVSAVPAARTLPPVPPAAAPTRLSDIMRELAPSAVPLSAPTVVSFHDDLEDLVEDGGVRTAQPAADSGVRHDAGTAATVRPVPVQPPAADRGGAMANGGSGVERSGARSVDLGGFVPRVLETFEGPARRIEQMGGTDFRLPDFSRLTPSSAAPLRPLVETMPPTPPPLQLAASTEVAANSAVNPTVADASSDAVDAAQSALGALAMGLAAPSSAMVAVQAVEPVPAAASASRQSLDDAIVEMLRPMVRDWLDAHLPEMVEKAISLELVSKGRETR